jgi:hypothetical protein
MFAHRGPPHRQGRGDPADRERPGPQAFDDPAAGRIAQGVEGYVTHE